MRPPPPFGRLIPCVSVLRQQGGRKGPATSDRWPDSRPFHGCAFTAPKRLGFEEQMFGADEQVRGRLRATKRRHTSIRSARRQALIMNEPIDLLQSHFGLAPAEARLALHLVAGETLRSAAVKLSISYETARTCLKSIFDKTGTCRQAELVIVILTALPGCVGAPAPRRLGSKKQISGENEQIPEPAQSD